MSLFKFSANSPSDRPRRLLIQPSATSPFRTSPSQLQEMTLDPDASNFSYVGMRSPGAPLTCGRSVKEIDEQLSALRKENFNLKLRLYFFEERLGSNFNADKDSIRTNIDLMIELENVRKELEEKQELLCQAAKAMEIEEDERRKEIASKNRQIRDLKNMIGVEKEGMLQLKEDSDCETSTTEEISKVDSLEILQPETIQDFKKQLRKERQRADHLAGVVEITQSQLKEKTYKLDSLKYELEKSNKQAVLYNERLSALEKELTDKTIQLQTTLYELEERNKVCNKQESELQDLSKIFNITKDQLSKQDKKADKYKSMLMQCENKNGELMMYIDTLENKIQNLEQRLETTLNEVKRTSNNTDSHQSTEKLAKSSNTDVELFSARNSIPDFAEATSPTQSSLDYNSPISIPQMSPLKLNTPSKSKSNPSIPCLTARSEGKSSSLSGTNLPVSQDEFLELKKNHYKACKIIKTMIQKKNEFIEEINTLKNEVTDRESKIQGLSDQVEELSMCRSIFNGGLKKKSIQEKVTEMNFTASSDPAANMENSMADNEVHLVEQYKDLANELERKIEVLTATLKEKDNQLNRLKIDLEAKSNQIIDLEFEVLALTQGVNQSINSSCEYSTSLDQERLEKDQLIEKLENELKKRTCDLQGIVNKELWAKNRDIEKMQIVLKKRDQQVNDLEKNVFNKDVQLKTLKEKINELGIHVNLPPGIIDIDCSSASQFESKNVHERLQLYLEERKQMLDEIEELKLKLANNPDFDENILSQLQSDYQKVCEELEKSEKCRNENQEICSILSVRLEELCNFLNTLLKQKSVLGFLGAEQTRKLQTVLNKSIDLSRTLSSSFCLNPDQSLLQLTNITNLLNSTRDDSCNFDNLLVHDEENNSILSIVPSDVTLTYQNHLNKVEQSEVIKVLRNQVANLKREIELRDVELEKKAGTVENDEQLVDLLIDYQPDSGKLNTSSTLVAEKSTANTLKNKSFENQSESESWSEPDRDVSLARIGLNDDSLKRLAGSGKRNRCGGGCNLSTESTEDEEGHGFSRTPSKKGSLAESRQTIISLHEQVCEMEVKLKDKENQLLAAQVAYYEADNMYKQQQIKIEETKRQNAQLTYQINLLEPKVDEAVQLKQISDQQVEDIRQEYNELLLQIKETNKKLSEAEKQKSIVESKIAEQQRVILTLEEFRKNVETAMNNKDKEMYNTINKMEVEKANAISIAQNNERLLSKAKADIAVAEEQLHLMHQREEHIREEMETNYNHNLMQLQDEYKNKTKTLENEYEMQTNKCREAVVQIKEYYEKEYVKRSEAETRYIQFDALSKEVEKLRSTIQESESKLRSMEMAETEHQNKIHTLHKELDKASDQYAESILEKTRLKNENIALEQKFHNFSLKEAELIGKVSDLQKELLEVQSNLHMQVTKLEHQKSMLEVKIHKMDSTNIQLQSTNAELHNHLLKLQTSKSGEPSLSLPNSLSNKSLHVSYMRQLSDHSGYTSEDIPITDNRGSSTVPIFVNRHNSRSHTEPETDHERTHGNSSPDLGIESDHGRFSSLEANTNLPRPLLPTLELTESMNSLLDPVQDLSCASDGCCKRTKEIANENVELRKRLLRTRRALEETLNRLTLANRQKKEVEKSICKQIHKTSQVLRKAKANLDSGSETDIVKN